MRAALEREKRRVAVKCAVNLPEGTFVRRNESRAGNDSESEWDEIAITQALHLLHQLTHAFN